MHKTVIKSYETVHSLFTEIKIDYYYLAYRRIFELILIILLVPIWVPITLVLALIIGLYFQKFPFIIQKRIGYLSKPFPMLKFRTVRANRKDALCSFGTYLRKYHLDEFPQLINVIIGNMSLIGPRPFPKNYDKELFRRHNDYHIRYYVKPGITGLWQVSDKKREKENTDLEYLINLNLFTDLQIIIRSILMLFISKLK